MFISRNEKRVLEYRIQDVENKYDTLWEKYYDVVHKHNKLLKYLNLQETHIEKHSIIEPLKEKKETLYENRT